MIAKKKETYKTYLFDKILLELFVNLGEDLLDFIIYVIYMT